MRKLDNRKIFFLVTVVLITFFIGYRVYDNYLNLTRLNHYDEIYEFMKDRQKLMAEDGLMEVNELWGEDAYHYTDKLYLDNGFKTIDFNVTQRYREFMMECGIHSNETKYCETDHYKGAYTFSNQDNKFFMVYGV